MKSYKNRKKELKDFLINHSHNDEWFMAYREYLDLLQYGKAAYYITEIFFKAS